MIISKTPFRVSFLGGGTDFPKYYMKNGGCVIGTTIDKYCYVNARFLPPVFRYKHRIVWSKNEVVNSNEEIIHPTIRSIFQKLKIKKGLEIHYNGDLPKNSGLGTSSSFCVGLINSITKLYRKNISKKELSDQAIFVEQKMLKENCGSQDPVWASYGGFNFINFKRDGTINVKPINISDKKKVELNKNLILIYTGYHRISNDIERDKIKNLDKNIHILENVKKLTFESKSILQKSSSFDILGEIFHEYWNLKKQLSLKVTNNKINEIYDEAIQSGASGGKIIGSGGGGFLLFYCKNKHLANLKKRLNKLVFVDFKFESDGSKIIFINK